MAQSQLTRSTAASIGFEEFTEAATAAVLRALDARTRDSKGSPFPGTITVGVYLDPDRKPPELEGPVEAPRRREGLTGSDVRALSTGKPISKESVGQVTDMLQRDYTRLGVKFANSLGQDFFSTMDQLFELSGAERESVYSVSKEFSADLDYLSRVLAAMFEYGDDLQFDLDISSSQQPTAVAKKKEEEKKKGIDWEIKIETKCETDKKCSAGASLTIKF